MTELYLDCSMGCAGDMLSAALYELFPEKDRIIEKLNSIEIPGVRYTAKRTDSCGITGTHMKVEFNDKEEHQGEYNCVELHKHHHYHHTGFKDICSLIDSLNIETNVKESAKTVYGFIAFAESCVHGKEMDNIHFHELGTMDAVADVVAVCYMMSLLKPEHITASTVRIGYGTVKCAHGIMSVPAPATTLLLLGIPVFTGDIECEMCTPTGAALVKYFVNEFGKMPAMTMSAVGYGMGSRKFDRPNCVRAILGTS